MIDRRKLVACTLGAACAPTLGDPALAAPLALDEGEFVNINGLDQWITIRGTRAENPVLVWLHGGPGMAMSYIAPVFADWERDFTIVQWDQPGSGATAQRTAEQGPLTLERYTADGLSVVGYIRQRLRTPKVALMGISWGTELGVTMVKQRPELFSAYVGTAQVTGRRGFKLGYEMALEAARKRGDAAGVAALEEAGLPPYSRFEDFLTRQAYTNPPGLPPSEADAAAGAALTAFVKANLDPNARYLAYAPPPGGLDYGKFIAVQHATFEAAQTWEIRDLGQDYPIPVFVFQGENDFNAPPLLAREFVEEIHAPMKAFELIAGASHNTIGFHDELLRLLRKHLLPVVA